ncbi:MAG: dTDP-glucose 4,6-dehydratase [uncultured Sphingomonas sp.]|uniref:dTDP-glucose 4,6-dehydratase n=1 Tax=uncultured Sphingomonas sp. TaxID=158754 RepID=A0A6J4TQ76_9SPHN|nr:MAG: dTDP-glucose 4,6-dehydratase [uncultured Sphingomonas sp.]
MAVLVTGAAGFIGYHISRALLERGEQVVGIDNLSSYYDVGLKTSRMTELSQLGGQAFRFSACDIADNVALTARLTSEKFDRIVHLAAQAGVRYSLKDPGAYAAANLIGHLNLLEWARQREVSHLIYASSSSVYGANTVLPFRVEDRTDRPISLYAATKRADELMSESYSHLFRLSLTGLRFFTVYGPWGRPDMAMWTFTDAISEGRPVYLFNEGRMRRDFTYIDDVIAGVLACLDRPPVDDGLEKAGGSRSPHALYNIGNSRSEELMRVVELIEQQLGRKAIIHLQPMQPGDVPDTYADISATRRDHGFEPRTSLDEGVPRFVEWYRSFHGLA